MIVIITSICKENQSKKGLTLDGIYGANTRVKLNSLIGDNINLNNQNLLVNVVVDKTILT